MKKGNSHMKYIMVVALIDPKIKTLCWWIRSQGLQDLMKQFSIISNDSRANPIPTIPVTGYAVARIMGYVHHGMIEKLSIKLQLSFNLLITNNIIKNHKNRYLFGVIFVAAPHSITRNLFSTNSKVSCRPNIEELVDITTFKK